jgi:hypothetical protein
MADAGEFTLRAFLNGKLICPKPKLLPIYFVGQ